MKTVEATTLISSTIKKGKTTRAQVTIVIGEGPGRRSVTRHLKREGGVWVGRNPDDSAESLHTAANKRIFQAQTTVQEVADVLEKFRKIAEGKLQNAPDDFFARLLEKSLSAAIERGGADLHLAEEDLKNAETHKENVEQEGLC